MDIEQRKKSFLDLLRSKYEAQKANAKDSFPYILTKSMGSVSLETLDDSSKVIIEENILRQYGFGERDFWDIIVPALKNEGYIESYEDPRFTSIRGEYYDQFPEYIKKVKRLRECDEALPPSYSFMRALGHNIESDRDEPIRRISVEMTKLEKEIRVWVERADSNFPHVFVVNEDKLSTSKSDKKAVSFDGSLTVIFKDRRHVFHADKGKRGLPLRFFKVLWGNRSEIKSGKHTKKGVTRDGYYYAQQLNLSDDSFAYGKSTEIQTTVSNLIKGLNRVFRAKKIPAKVAAKGGVLLEVKNP